MNAFVGLAAFFYGFLPYNSTLGLILFVSAKILVDSFLEASRKKEAKNKDK